MILIAHRGNFNGKNEEQENSPDYIEEAIKAGYNVEVDAWLIEDKWMLGHDFPKYEVPLSFLERPEIWTHAKNLVGHVSLWHKPLVQCFWHDKDEYVFTSKGIKWAKAGVITWDGVVVMPETNQLMTARLKNKRLRPLGVCSDNFDLFGMLK